MPLQIVRNDIARMDVDAIVCPSNTELVDDGGGVCHAVFEAAGPARMRATCERLAPCKPGEAVVAPGFDLPARHVVFATGPVWDPNDPRAEELLAKTYRNALAAAVGVGANSVALPLLSAGAFGFSVRTSFDIAVEQARSVLDRVDMDIYLVVYGRASLLVGSQRFGRIAELIDDAYVARHDKSNRSRDSVRRFRSALSTEAAAPRDAFDASEEMGAERPFDEGVFGERALDERALDERALEEDALYAGALDKHALGKRVLDEHALDEDTCAGSLLDETPFDAAEEETFADMDRSPAPRASGVPSYMGDYMGDYESSASYSAARPYIPDATTPLRSASSAPPRSASSAPSHPSASESPRFAGSAPSRSAAPPSARSAATPPARSAAAPPPAYSSSGKERGPGRLSGIIDDLKSRLLHLDASFSQTLLALIDEKGLTDAQVYRRANVSRQLFAKIRKDRGYRPTKQTALALAIALRLDIEETDELIGRAGITLSDSSAFDVIVKYFIDNEIYDIDEVNAALFAFDQPLLGSCA